jgi:hypothetical protein
VSDRGAYGFRIAGLDAAAHLLVPAPATWPTLRIAVRRGTAAVDADRIDERSADLRLQTLDGSIALDRDAGLVEFCVPEGLGVDALVHPFLAPAALVSAHWLGRETFHAGTFVVDGGAWAVVGHKGAGKSTLLAWLAERGVPVLGDDVLVIDAGDALAGPRSIDLRVGSALRLGVGEALGVVGARERWRVRLGPVPAAVPLRGWVHLGWGAATAVEPIRGAERLARLAGHRGVRLAPVGAGRTLLELGALPAYELRRPPEWGSADAAGERLLDAVAGR